MKARWGLITALLVTVLAAAPLATAGAQAPPTTGDPQITEGSAPPGGNVDCEVGPELDPDRGPPGTAVTVTAQFSGNCDDLNPIFYDFIECFGEVTGAGIEPIAFPLEIEYVGEAAVRFVGSFTAPATEPDPPVVDAVENLAVTVTCEVAGVIPLSAPAEGEGTTYRFPSVNFALELFAEHDGEQPTFVEVDQAGDVVSATPTFAG